MADALNAIAGAPFISDDIVFPPDDPFVTLSHAFSWILSRRSIGSLGLAFLPYNPEAELEEAIETDFLTARYFAGLLRLCCTGEIALRGKFIESSDIAIESIVTDTIPAPALHDFAQFDVFHDGLLRGRGINWPRIRSGMPCKPALQFPAYISVLVERGGLLEHFSLCEIKKSNVGESGANYIKVAANRQLDHDLIRREVAEWRTKSPNLSKGAAAASIVANLSPNPKTGRRRDARNVERIISPLWEEGLSQSPPDAASPHSEAD